MAITICLFSYLLPRWKMKIGSIEDGLNIMEEAINRARLILKGVSVKDLFSTDDYMKYYTCVYCICTQSRTDNYACQLYGRYMAVLEESVVSTVLPSLSPYSDVFLIVEVDKWWERYKVMAKCLSKFFSYLDSHFVAHAKVLSLNDAAVQCFHDLVCDKVYLKCRDTAIFLISQERDGKQIDWSFVKMFLTIFTETDQQNRYYQNFEQELLAVTARHYSQLSAEWLHSGSLADYVSKVKLCLINEHVRAGKFLNQTASEKLLEVVNWHMIGPAGSKLIEKQKSECLDPIAYQDLLSKCSSMSIADEHSAPLFQ